MDSGLTADLAISPDGGLLAYASDRGGAGNLDLWVQQVPGGEPTRTTTHEADDREGGGVYVVSALGGEPRLLVQNGRGPRFSPDGGWVGYYFGGAFLGWARL